MNILTLYTIREWKCVQGSCLVLGACLLFLSACTTLTKQSNSLRAQEAPFFQKYKWAEVSPHEDLPAGGVLVYHPQKNNVIYYHTVRRIMEIHPQRGIVKTGLWLSRDKGQTWVRCSDMNFECLYIHPKTFVLYAILADYRLGRTPNKRLFLAQLYKIARYHPNGRIWEDIGPDVEKLVNCHEIFQDPNNPNLICFTHGMETPDVYQAKDDKYLEWKSYSTDDWVSRHNGWSWDEYFFVLSGEKPLLMKGEEISLEEYNRLNPTKANAD